MGSYVGQLMVHNLAGVNRSAQHNQQRIGSRGFQAGCGIQRNVLTSPIGRLTYPSEPLTLFESVSALGLMRDTRSSATSPLQSHQILFEETILCY